MLLLLHLYVRTACIVLYLQKAVIVCLFLYEPPLLQKPPLLHLLGSCHHRRSQLTSTSWRIMNTSIYCRAFRRKISSSGIFPPLKQLLVHVLGLREFKPIFWGSGRMFQPLLTGCYWTRTGGGVDLHHYWWWGISSNGSGLLHHPEATHLLFPVIEDVTLWSVGQFPIMFSYLRGPPRYLLFVEWWKWWSISEAFAPQRSPGMWVLSAFHSRSLTTTQETKKFMAPSEVPWRLQIDKPDQRRGHDRRALTTSR